MIDTWLNYAERLPCGYTKFRLIDVSEKKQPDSAILSYIGEEIIGSYRNLEYLKVEYQNEPEANLVKYIKQYVISSEKNTITKNVWQGDFGEIIAGLIVSYFENLTVPLKKLRYKFNKDRSVFCTDMIAHNSSAPITDLHYYEIKTRLRLRKETIQGVSSHVTVIAHNSLMKDEQAPNEFIADFLARNYYETQEWAKATQYSDIVKNPLKYKKAYELFFIVDDKSTLTDILNDLEHLPPTLTPLRTTVVLIKDLARLLVIAKKAAIDTTIKKVYNK